MAEKAPIAQGIKGNRMIITRRGGDHGNHRDSKVANTFNRIKRFLTWISSQTVPVTILEQASDGRMQHEGYFGTDLVILNRGQMTETTPELAPRSPSFHATPTLGHLATTGGLACNRPHKRQIFSGIGFRAWNPPASKPRPYH
ncbi:hypothetical protein AVEN_158016-1 [Araneus ventricosus]|uniref:Uncharacterized protein n=1 Tax=Araneus ventricosus TaxID=182803 RepID=A0A4Y2Q4E7_ARAVE|nr:hypothetical protein AVEN_158016-1 [Araneus ventricosus]